LGDILGMAVCWRETALHSTMLVFICGGIVMLNYRQNFVAGGCYFFTVNLLERQQTLLSEHIVLLRDSVCNPKGRTVHGFAL
jgi:Tfp pilus assembly protein PilZ